MTENPRMCLNIGSGQRPFGKPWINIDSQAKWNPDVVQGGAKFLSSLPPNSVEMICLHHVLEHFGCGEADGMLKDSYRVLKPSGSLLVFVPDMLQLSRMWLDGTLSDQVYFTNVYGAWMGDEADRHKWGFTHQSLFRTLRGAGFDPGRVGKFDWRDIPGTDIARDTWILGLEARK